MKPIKTLIIDDESIARQRLTYLLESFPNRFEIIGEARNGIEGADMINSLKPELIFLDIQMPGKTGFEMLEDLVHMPRVVFCTAYENFALQAFETMAIDYLVKPLEIERLQVTLEKIERNWGAEPYLQVKELLDMVKNQAEKSCITSIPHKIGDRVLLIKTESITYFKANEKYVEFFTKQGEKYLTELSLKKLLDRLPDSFVQVHRGTIVNTALIKEYRKYFKGKYIIIFDDVDSTRVETGRSFSATLKRIINID